MSRIEVEDILKKLKPIIGSRADAIWLAYLAADSSHKTELETMLRLLQAKVLMEYRVDDQSIQLPPPSDEVAKGKYKVGSVVYNNRELYPFGLHEQDWIQHISIFGRSGAGKTNTVYCLLLQLLHHNKPFLVFDWKRNYRDLVQMANEDIKVFTPGRRISPFTFNPLRFPPGTEPTIWAKKIVEMISLAYFGGEGSNDILLRAIHKVYESFGVYDGTVTKWPTLSDLLPELHKMKLKGRAAEWMSTVLRTLHSACYGEMGQVVSQQQQTPLQELLKQNVVLELDGLTHNDKLLIIGSLLLWIHHYRMQEPSREQFKHALIIEEAHHLLLKTTRERESITEIVLREIRELGESIVLIDQMPSSLTPTAIANTACTITMNLKQRTDVSTAANYSLLDDTEKWIFGKLPVGMAVVKLQNRFYEPFLIRLPHVDLQKGFVTDELVANLMSKNQHTGYSASSSAEVVESEGIEGIPEPAIERLSEDELDFVVSISKDPLKNTVQRYVGLNWSMRKGDKVKNDLVQKGVVIPEEIITSRGRLMLYNLTARGKEVTSAQGYDTRKTPASLLHAYGVNVAKKHFESLGYRVELEHDLNGYADLLIEMDGKKYFVEFETGKSDAIKNITKCLGVQCDGVVSVALNEKVRQRILAQIQARGLAKEKALKVILLNDLDKPDRSAA